MRLAADLGLLVVCLGGCASGPGGSGASVEQGQSAVSVSAVTETRPADAAPKPVDGGLLKAGSKHYPESGDADGGFAPIIVDEEAEWTRPELGKTFELKFVPPEKPEDPRPPEKLWVHKVSRKIPDMDNPASWREWARKVEVDVEPKYESGQWWIHAKDDKGRVHGVSIHVSRREMLYGDRRVPPEKEIYEASKKTTEEQMRKWGEERAKALGWWPKGVNEKSAGIGVSSGWCTDFPDKYVNYIRTTYGGVVEGKAVYGEGLMFRIRTNPAGQVELIEMRWAESERYRELPCKTAQEAFRALNEGCAMGIPKWRCGQKAYYAGWMYYLSEIHGDFIQPMFIFRLDDPSHGFPVFVPAIQDKYFKDSKQQIVSSGEWLVQRGKEQRGETRSGK